MGNTSTTNQKQDSCTAVSLSCDHLWSMAQQFAYARLCDKKGNNIALTAMYSSRARRIAATYARFYLETEVGGNPKLKGRYYWMALGAFASKTVACSLEDLRVIGISSISMVHTGLAKGNFWLFMDVACWHWYWSNYPQSFNVCATKRDAEQCVPQVKAVLDKLPWATEALKAVQRFKYNDNIKEGMVLVQKFEQTANQNKRPAIQFEHLMAIANHEQGNVLQPLIYDDSAFSGWVAAQRWRYIKWMTPTLKIVFSHTCDTNQSRLESIAPDNTILENFSSRMKWIEKVAEQFHGLMQGTKQDSDKVYMEQELKTIAGWVGYKDKLDKL